MLASAASGFTVLLLLLLQYLQLTVIPLFHSPGFLPDDGDDVSKLHFAIVAEDVFQLSSFLSQYNLFLIR